MSHHMYSSRHLTFLWCECFDSKLWENRPFSSATSTSLVSLLSTWLLPSHWLATALLWWTKTYFVDCNSLKSEFTRSQSYLVADYRKDLLCELALADTAATLDKLQPLLMVCEPEQIYRLWTVWHLHLLAVQSCWLRPPAAVLTIWSGQIY